MTDIHVARKKHIASSSIAFQHGLSPIATLYHEHTYLYQYLHGLSPIATLYHVHIYFQSNVIIRIEPLATLTNYCELQWKRQAPKARRS